MPSTRYLVAVTFEHDEMWDVVTAIDHGPIDEVLAVLDEHLLQELGIRDVYDRSRTTIPAQNLAALADGLGNLKQIGTYAGSVTRLGNVLHFGQQLYCPNGPHY